MGGVSDGFALEGFDVTGIDIVDAPKMLGYKHRFIQADMFSLKGEDFRGFDVVWGSPPCRDFTAFSDEYKHPLNGIMKWKKPKNPKKGMELVDCFLSFVKQANPKIWIMENVPGLANHLKLKPNQKSSIGKTMRRCFWGNYPYFLMPMDANKKPLSFFGNHKTRSWERAKIPLACSRAFAKACKEALQQ